MRLAWLRRGLSRRGRSARCYRTRMLRCRKVGVARRRAGGRREWLRAQVADAGSGRVVRKGEYPPGLDEAGAGEFSSVRLGSTAVEFVDLVVAASVAEMPRRDVPQAVVMATLGRLHDVNLVWPGSDW